MLRKLAVLTTVAALASIAYADNPTYGRRIAADPAPYNFTGVYLDVASGRGFTAGELNIEDGFNVDSLAGTGWLGQARVGVDWQPTGSPFLFGVFAGYGLGQTEFNVDAGPDNLLNASLEKTWHAGGRLGLVSGRGLVYGAGAWQQAEFNLSSSDPNFGGSDTLDGWKALIGLEYAVTPTLALGLEYGHTWFGNVDVKYNGSPTGVRVDLQDDEVWARLKWRPAAGFFN